MGTWSDEVEKQVAELQGRVDRLEESTEGAMKMLESRNALQTIVINSLRKTVKEIAQERDALKAENEELKAGRA